MTTRRATRPALLVSLALVVAGAVPGSAATAQEPAPARASWSAAETLSGAGQHGSYPRLAVGGDLTTAVWEGPDDPAESGARAVLARQHGTGLPWGAAENLGWGWSPDVAADGAGDTLVGWSGGTTSSPDQEVTIRLRPADGGAWETPVTVSDTPATRSAYLGGVALSDSGAAVVWWQDAVDDDPHAVNRGYVAYRSAAGSWKTPVKVFGTGPGHEMGAAIDADGDVLVGYETKAGVFVRLRVVGEGWKPQRRIADPTDVSRLTVALSDNGNVRVVAWQGDRLKARRYAGGAWGRVVRLAPGRPTESDLVMDPAGNTTAGWVRRDSSVAAVRWPRGKPLGAPLTVADVPTDPRFSTYSPDLAVNEVGDVVLAWERDGGGARVGRVQASLRPYAGTWLPWERVTPAGDDSWSFSVAVRGSLVEAAWSEWEPDPVVSRVRYGTTTLP